MLTTIGEVPVNTLEVSGLTDAAIARDTLRSVCREVQATGWYFNVDDCRVFQPSLDGSVSVPPNALLVRPARTREVVEERRIVQRGGKLYDLTNNTAIFSEYTGGAPSMYVVWFFDFETLPETARRYITVRAARIFQTKVMGSEQLHVFTSEHESECKAALRSEDNAYYSHNYLTDSESVTAIWMRAEWHGDANRHHPLVRRRRFATGRGY